MVDTLSGAHDGIGNPDAARAVFGKIAPATGAEQRMLIARTLQRG